MKKFYFLIMTMFAALAANATTITGDVYWWNSETKSAEVGTEPAQFEATFGDDGVINVSDFLESGKAINLVVNNDGTVTHDIEGNVWVGDFVFGSFGQYEQIYHYNGYWDYDDFSYYVSDGKKTLHFGASAPDSKGDWYDVYFILPDEFTPRDVYAGMTQYQVEVTFYDGEDYSAGTVETVTAYVDGKTILFPSLFGSKLTYSFDDSWNFVSGNKGWLTSDYTYGGTSNTYTYFYGDEYLTYDPLTLSFSDYVWLYESNVGFYFSFDPTDLVTFDSEYDGECYINRDYVYTDDYYDVKVAQGYGTLTIPNVFGSGKTLAFETYSDGTTKVYVDGKEATGTITLTGSGSITAGGTEVSLSSISLYASYADYETGSYEDGGETYEYEDFTIAGYLGSTWTYFYFYPEEGFTPISVADPFDGITPEEVTVRILDDSGAEESDYTHTANAYTTEDGAVKVDGAFGLILKYNITDGSISSSNSGYVQSNYTYNGTANSYLYFYGDQYLSYDATKRVIKDYIYFYYSGAGRYFTITWPAEEGAVNDIKVSEDNNAPVEYFNLQGIRVANPENGLFIRRQGSKATKVLVK